MLKMYRLLSTWLLPRVCRQCRDNHRAIQIKDALGEVEWRLIGRSCCRARAIAYQARILNIEHHLTN